MTYYRADLARIHHEGFGRHAEVTAPGLLALLEPVRERGGLVLEVGCGTGLLTRRLVDAGHQVVATDASPAMLDLARVHVPQARAHALLALPDDPVPAADAVVSVGHALSYLRDADAVRRALRALAAALRPGGILAVDLCDLLWGRAREQAPPYARVESGWALVTRFDVPTPEEFVRTMTTFVREDDGRYRRDDEVHRTVLVDTGLVPGWLDDLGLESVTVGTAFGTETLPVGLHAIVARRPLAA